ncbi:phosphatidylinositol 3,4,5-trisphosphate 5-phosphatase 2B isoform X1 [Strongylocentrotus purpuratus]|uniref:phosphatidylinositol-3,4,5-trisphosphate 5-phosphatase n=1 Tax=Strongylocentrotus purpuratus TaxID=7668 RepID=A0A7M7NL59_STRPU|nr:phosphatidylinositol 3,4,5-trisphosphate 5-phosphatase 2B isoform X1 [Strongylocentrotus purpuratus]
MATQYPWYHGRISRLETEELLHQSGKDGAFVVRDSENIKGAYVLSVLCDSRIYQYRIVPDSGGPGFLMKSSDPNSKFHPFSNLSELVNSYKITNNGLCCPLQHPVEAKKEEEDQDTDDEDERFSSDTSGSSQDGPQHLLQARLDAMDLTPLEGGDFVGRLKEYVNKGVREDSEEVRLGGGHASNFRSMMMASTKDLTRQLNFFQLQLDAMQCLFDVQLPSNKKFTLPDNSPVESSPENLYKRFAECEKQVKSLESKVKATLRDLYKPSMDSHSPSSTLVTKATPQPGDDEDVDDDEPATYMPVPDNLPSFSDRDVRDLPTRNILPTPFEVKVLNVPSLTHPKVKLTVDLATGHLVVAKITGKEMNEDVQLLTHDKVAQLIKSKTSNTKLAIKLSNGKKKEYAFEDAKKRETFCQMLQYMKMVHSKSKEVDQISVFIGTWNMGDAPPPNCITTWLTCQGDGKTRDSRLVYMPHDLYVIGTQESTLSERDWVNRLKVEIQNICRVPGEKEYSVVTVCSLWGIRIAVLVKPEHQDRISHVRESSVKTGIANALGNKGAVGVSFSFNGTSFCFVNCHLTSGTEKCTRRNNNFHDILRGLSLGAKGLSLFDLNNQFHHIFWLGDLNYRIDWNVQEILTNIKSGHYEVLFNHDQLKIEKDQGKVFVAFEEDDITFPPTYRYELGHRSTYAYKKIKKTGIRINQPSWCDRVLWKSYPDTHIINTTYGCTTDIVSSDHSPVFSTFDVGLSASTVIPKEQSEGGTQDVKIIFTQVDATIVTSMCSSRFYLEFFSTCLEAKSEKSGYNSMCQQNNTLKLTKPSWTKDQLVKLNPIVSDVEYLEEQFILVAIKSEDSDESYGEFVVSLRNRFESSPVLFKSILTHQGHRTGEVEGMVHVKSRDESLYGGFRKAKTYELVKFEDKTDSMSSGDVSDETASAKISKAKVCIENTKNKVRQWVNKAPSEDHSRKSQEAAPPIPTAPRPRDLNVSSGSLTPPQSDPAPVPPTRRKNGLKVSTGKAMSQNGVGEESEQPPPLPPPRLGASPMSSSPMSTNPLNAALMNTMPMSATPMSATPMSADPMDGGEYMGLSLDAMPLSRSSAAEQSGGPDVGRGMNQVTKPRLRGCRSVPAESDIPPPLPSRLPAPPQRSLSRDVALPPPLPARPSLTLPPFHPERSDSETSDEGQVLEHSPPRRTPPALPGQQVSRLRDHWERRSSRDSSPDSNRSSVDTGDAKPALPLRITERMAPDGRPSSSSTDDGQLLLEGLPPPLPSKSRQNTPPRRTTDTELEDYDCLRRPITITEWLSNLGLMQYKQQLYDNGWDNVAFLDTITDQDLISARVESIKHRRHMLESITCIMAMQR